MIEKKFPISVLLAAVLVSSIGAVFLDRTLSAPEETNSKNKKEGENEEKESSSVIINEALARNSIFFTPEGLSKIRNSFVIVVGLGGVGSTLATSLVRSGVGSIRLIDFDNVTLSSLNRHSTAGLSDVGIPKVESCKKFYKDIAPWVKVDARVQLFEASSADDLLGGNPDWIVDCIDNLQTKIELIEYCHKRGIKVFSALGAACKSDPSTIQIADISHTFEDPLARSVRQQLKKVGIYSGIPVVYSSEKPKASLALQPLSEEEYKKGNVDELSALANFRVRILPVLGTLPCLFGNAGATYILEQLAGFPVEPLPIKNRRRVAGTLHRQLTSYYSSETQSKSSRLPYTEDDLLFIYEEVHRVKSIVAPFNPVTKPVILPFRRESGLKKGNLVLFEREESEKHVKEVLQGGRSVEEVWGEETVERADLRKREQEQWEKWR